MNEYASIIHTSMCVYVNVKTNSQCVPFFFCPPLLQDHAGRERQPLPDRLFCWPLPCDPPGTAIVGTHIPAGRQKNLREMRMTMMTPHDDDDDDDILTETTLNAVFVHAL